MRVFTRVTSLIRDCFDIRQASFDLPSQNLRRECCGQGPRRPWHVLPPHARLAAHVHLAVLDAEKPGVRREGGRFRCFLGSGVFIFFVTLLKKKSLSSEPTRWNAALCALSSTSADKVTRATPRATPTAHFASWVTTAPPSCPFPNKRDDGVFRNTC
jgi:hypothetical protein